MDTVPALSARDAQSGSAPAPRLSRPLLEFLSCLRDAEKFANVERLIWTPYGRGKERVGEHVYKNMVLAWYVHPLVPHLDLFEIWKLQLVHDAPEYLDGDTPALHGTRGEFDLLPARDDKEEREEVAIRRLTRKWKTKFKPFVDALHRYTKREREVDHFVSALEKFVACAEVCLDNGYGDKRLGVTVEMVDEYKRSKIAKHPVVFKMYEELLAYWKSRPDLQYIDGDLPPQPRKQDCCPHCGKDITVAPEHNA